MPGSSPRVARAPAGAASSRSLRLRAKTLIASSSARSRSSTIRSSDSDVESFTRQVQRATSFRPDVAGQRRRRPDRPRRSCARRVWRRGVVGVDLEVERSEKPSLRPRSMASARWLGDVGPALDVIEIVGEFRARLLLAVDDLGAQKRLVAHVGAQAAEEVGVDARTSRRGCRARLRARP